MIRVWMRDVDDIKRSVEVAPTCEKTIQIICEALAPIRSRLPLAPSVDKYRTTAKFKESRRPLANIDEVCGHQIRRGGPHRKAARNGADPTGLDRQGRDWLSPALCGDEQCNFGHKNPYGSSDA